MFWVALVFCVFTAESATTNPNTTDTQLNTSSNTSTTIKIDTNGDETGSEKKRLPNETKVASSEDGHGPITGKVTVTTKPSKTVAATTTQGASSSQSTVSSSVTSTTGSSTTSTTGRAAVTRAQSEETSTGGDNKNEDPGNGNKNEAVPVNEAPENDNQNQKVPVNNDEGEQTPEGDNIDNSSNKFLVCFFLFVIAASTIYLVRQNRKKITDWLSDRRKGRKTKYRPLSSRGNGSEQSKKSNFFF